MARRLLERPFNGPGTDIHPDNVATCPGERYGVSPSSTGEVQHRWQGVGLLISVSGISVLPDVEKPCNVGLRRTPPTGVLVRDTYEAARKAIVIPGEPVLPWNIAGSLQRRC